MATSFFMKGNQRAFFAVFLCFLVIGMNFGISYAETSNELTKVAVSQKLNKELLQEGMDTVTATFQLKGIGTPLLPPRNPIDLIFVIDQSGSMNWGNTNVNAIPNRLDHAREAVQRLAGLLQVGDQGGIIKFSSQAEVLQALTGNKNTLINSIKNDSSVPFGATAVGLGLHEAISIFDSQSSAGRDKVVILLSDGAETEWTADQVLQEADTANQKGIRVYTIGLGSSADQQLLSTMAQKTGGTYRFSPTMQQIDEMMQNIGGEIFDTAGDSVAFSVDIPNSPLLLDLQASGISQGQITTYGNGSCTVEYSFDKIMMGEEKEIKMYFKGNPLVSGRYDVTSSARLFYYDRDKNLHTEIQDPMKVRVVGNPELDPIGSKSVDEGQLLEFKVTGADPYGEPLVFVAQGLPPGATFNPQTQTFQWVPDFNQAGVYKNVLFIVSNQQDQDSEEITITVNNVNRAPVMDPIENKTVNEGERLEFTIYAQDPDGDSLTYTADNLPEGAVFDPNALVFSWTPTYDQAGVYEAIYFEATDGEMSDRKALTVTVNNVNRAPVLDPIGNKTVNEGSTLEFTVNGVDPDNDVLVYRAEGLPDGASFDPELRKFRWNPGYSQEGEYPSVSFEVYDGSLRDIEAITIFVNNVIQPTQPPVVPPKTDPPTTPIVTPIVTPIATPMATPMATPKVSIDPTVAPTPTKPVEKDDDEIPMALPADISVFLSADKTKYEEDEVITYTIKYKNLSKTKVEQMDIFAQIPEYTVIFDGAGGSVEEDAIQWTVKNLGEEATGEIKYQVKIGKIPTSEVIVANTASIDSEKVELIHTEDDSSSLKVMLYSNRYGGVRHEAYVIGYPDGSFRPENGITRAEVAAVFARILGLPLEGDREVTYSDVAGHWAEKYIDAVSKEGLFQGYADGAFRPDGQMTRAELAKVIFKYLGLKDVNPLEETFKDIKQHWARNYIEEIVRGKLIEGYEDGSFKPDNFIKRSEFVTLVNKMLYRGPLQVEDGSFTDVIKGHWAFGQIEEAAITHLSEWDENGNEILLEVIHSTKE